MLGQLVYAALSLRALDRGPNVSIPKRGYGPKIIVTGVLGAVTMLFARIIYSIVYGFTLKPSLSPFTGSLAVKVVLIFMVQLLAALCIGTVGFITRNLARDSMRSGRRVDDTETMAVK